MNFIGSSYGKWVIAICRHYAGVAFLSGLNRKKNLKCYFSGRITTLVGDGHYAKSVSHMVNSEAICRLPA